MFLLEHCFKEKYGKHVRSLELAWSRPSTWPKYTRDPRNIQVEVATNFLNMIRTKDVKIKELILTNWTLNRCWGHRGELLYALTNFVG